MASHVSFVTVQKVIRGRLRTTTPGNSGTAALEADLGTVVEALDSAGKLKTFQQVLAGEALALATGADHGPLMGHTADPTTEALRYTVKLAAGTAVGDVQVVGHFDGAVGNGEPLWMLLEGDMPALGVNGDTIALGDPLSSPATANAKTAGKALATKITVPAATAVAADSASHTLVHARSHARGL